MGSLDLQVTDMVRDLLLTTILIAGPVLLVGLIVGVAVSLFQALTSVQEQTMSLVPKMFAVMLVVLVLLIPALQLARDYTARVLSNLVELGLS